jgi:hypothetical protein
MIAVVISLIIILILVIIFLQNKQLTIGILLNYPFLEVSKDELVIPTEKSPAYIKAIPKYFLVNNGTKYGYPYDVVIGFYIKYHRPDIKVNFIYPDNVSVEEFKKNDIVFILIHDLIEALNIDSLIGKANIHFKKDMYSKLKSVLEKVDNVYPPYKYQKLFNSKCRYYKFLQNNKIPTESSTCVLIKNNTKEKFIGAIIDYAEKNKFKSFITKPDGGQEAIKFKVWKKVTSYKKDNNYSDEIYYRNNTELHKKLGKYYDTVLHFDKIIVQREIKGFNYYGKLVPYNKITPELKTYYVGNTYRYSVLVDRYCWRQPIVDGGSKNRIDCFKKCKDTKGCTDPCSLGSIDKPCNGPDITKKDLERIQKLCAKILKILPSIIIKGVKLPRLLTRVDVAVEAEWYANKERKLYINEIEFVPSLFHAGVKYDIIPEVAKQIIKIMEIYRGAI